MWIPNNRQNKVINAVDKLIPEMLRTKAKQKISSEIFHTTIGNYDNSFRSRKSNSGGAVEEGFCTEFTCTDFGTEYTDKTTLHGLKYVGDSHLHLIERLFWLTAFVLGILGAGYYITVLYEKWKVAPMIVSLSSTPMVLEAVPFPAITICNMNGARKSVAEPIMRSEKTDVLTLLNKKVVSDLCKNGEADDVKINATWTTEQKILIKVSQPCHNMLVSCEWRSKVFNCSDIFNPELTDEGMCCAFNKVRREFIYRNPKEIASQMNYTFLFDGYDWNPEKGYAPGIDITTVPWRTGGPGRSNGLSVVLDAQVGEYYCSSTASIGFKTMLHNPVEAPKMSDLAFFLSPGFEYRVEVFPKISQSAASLRNIPLEKRLCLFQEERSLALFRTYTLRNCQLECQSNFTLNVCDCVPFYLPKAAHNRICGTIDDDCVSEAKDKMEKEQLEQAVNASTDTAATLACKCLPGCDTMEYSKLMSSSKLEDSFAIKSNFLWDRDPAYYKGNMTVAHFFFVERTFTGTEKGEIFGFTEFLSNTGGLLGLFLGFSIMSFVEIIYFLSLKMACTWWRKRNRHARIQTSRQPLPFTR